MIKIVEKWTWGMILFMSTVVAFAGITQRSETATVNIPVGAIKEVNADIKYTHITIKPWKKEEIQIVATVLFKGSENERIKLFLDEFKENVTNQVVTMGSRLQIGFKIDLPNKVQIGSKNVGIIWGYGADELQMHYEISLPDYLDLSIAGSYRDLIFEDDYSAPVYVNHYNGDFRAKNFDKLEIKLKYGDASWNSAQQLTGEMYEQKIKVNQLGKANLSAKYSRMETKSIKSLEVEAYESKFYFEDGGSITGELKYSEIIVENALFELALTSNYESDFTAKIIEQIDLNNSKYSNFEVNRVLSGNVEDSYEDNVKIGTLGKWTAKSKYNKLDVKVLGGYIQLDGYEADLEIDIINEDAEGIELSGKYCSLKSPQINKLFKLDVNVQYGDIKYESDALERRIYIKESEKLEMILQPKQDLKVPHLKIRGYEMDVILL